MLKGCSRDRVLGLAVALLVVAPVWASGASSPDATDDGTILRLERLLAVQQDKIDALEQQLATVSSQDADAARTDAMRDQIRQILSEQEFRESLMPSVMLAGYDDGFYIKSSDDNFKLKINGYTQFRWTHYAQQRTNAYLIPGYQRDDRTGFDLQRTRLIFSGHMWEPALTYHIQLNADAARNYDVTIHWAFVNYKFCDAFQVQAGVFKLASTRSQLTGEWGFQFVDRPMFEQVFGLGDGLGVRFWGNLFDGKVTYMLDIANAWNSVGSPIIGNDPQRWDNNPAILFRAVWHAMGDDPKEWLFEGDVNNSQSPALDIGFHYAFNDDQRDGTTRLPFPVPRRFRTGGYGLTNSAGMQMNQFGIDAAFKYMGFSFTGEYDLRILDPRRAGRRPFTPWWLLTRQGDTTIMQGAYGQFGYMLPIPALENKLEAVARIGGISTVANEQEGTWEWAVGLNYYLRGAEAGHKTKLQMDIGRVYEAPISSNYSSLANVNDEALIFRVQLQVGF